MWVMYVQVQFYKYGYYFDKASFPTKYSGNCKTFSHNTTPVALCHLMLPVEGKDHTAVSQSRHRGSSCTALPMLNLGTRWEWERDPVPTVSHEAGWPPGLIWMGTERRKSLASTGFQTSNNPAHGKP
jgi:hypothetical protein